MKHQARKRFGQNFLVDQSVINHIVDSIQPQADDLMIEIGPGDEGFPFGDPDGEEEITAFDFQNDDGPDEGGVDADDLSGDGIGRRRLRHRR